MSHFFLFILTTQKFLITAQVDLVQNGQLILKVNGIELKTFLTLLFLIQKSSFAHRHKRYKLKIKEQTNAFQHLPMQRTLYWLKSRQNTILEDGPLRVEPIFGLTLCAIELKDISANPRLITIMTGESYVNYGQVIYERTLLIKDG